MWVTLLVAAAVTSVAGPAPSPSSEPACPEPTEVAAQLARLGVDTRAQPEITVVGGQMRVALRGEEGQTLGNREVAAPASCQERANVAAVLVATWMGVWPAASPPTPAPPPSLGETRAPAATTPPAPRLELAVALGGAYDGNALTPGLTLESRWRVGGPWRALLGLCGTLERDERMGTAGRAGYARPSLEAGAVLALGHGRVRGEMGLAGRLGLMLLRGKDLTVTHFAARAVPGVAGRLRLVLAGKAFSPFASVEGVYWLGRQHAILDDDDMTVELPRWDAQAGLGVLWSRGP